MKCLLISVSILCLMFSSVAYRSKECGLPSREYGSCEGKIIKWSYESAKKKCVKFDYSGCKGNDNRFDSQQLCKEKCVELIK